MVVHFSAVCFDGRHKCVQVLAMTGDDIYNGDGDDDDDGSDDGAVMTDDGDGDNIDCVDGEAMVM